MNMSRKIKIKIKMWVIRKELEGMSCRENFSLGQWPDTDTGTRI